VRKFYDRLLKKTPQFRSLPRNRAHQLPLHQELFFLSFFMTGKASVQAERMAVAYKQLQFGAA